MGNGGNLFEELKRRNVFRVGAAYAVVGWISLQILDVVVEPLNLPEWTASLVIVLLAIGFPVALLFAWAFEMTPDGVKKSKDVEKEISVTATTGQKLNYFIIAGLVVALGYSVWGRQAPQPPAETVATTEAAPETKAGTTEPHSASIAVLPFVNMSSDPEQEYFSDGISEELLNVLARAGDLKVAARTSSFSFKGQNRPVGEIAEVLGVAHILEGSVRKSGTQIRITAQLIRVSDGFHMWSDTYDRELVNIFAIQDEIAQAIVSELRVRLTNNAQTASTGTDNAEAYQEYLKGRYFWNFRTVPELYKAVKHFERATELDPTYVDAWSGLGETWVLLPDYEYDDAKATDQFERAKQAGDKALELAPESGRGHLVLASTLQNKLAWRESLAHYSKALEYNPDYATAWHWYGGTLSDLGRHKEAMAAMEKALELDPLSGIIGTNAAEVYAKAGDYDAALLRINQTVSFAPDFNYAWEVKGFVHVIRQEFDEARTAFEEYARVWGEPVLEPQSVDLAERYLNTGKAGELPDWRTEGSVAYDLYYVTITLVLAGQYDAALDFVEHQSTSNIRSPAIYFLGSVLVREKLGHMPRYQELVKRLLTVEGEAN